MEGCFLQLALLAENNGEIVVRLRVVRSQGQGLFISGACLLRLALVQQEITQSKVRGFVLRLKCQCMPILGERVVKFSCRVQGCPQGGTIHSNSSARRDCALQHSRRGLVGTRLIGDHAEAIETLGVTHILLQSLYSKASSPLRGVPRGAREGQRLPTGRPRSGYPVLQTSSPFASAPSVTSFVRLLPVRQTIRLLSHAVARKNAKGWRHGGRFISKRPWN